MVEAMFAKVGSSLSIPRRADGERHPRCPSISGTPILSRTCNSSSIESSLVAGRLPYTLTAFLRLSEIHDQPGKILASFGATIKAQRKPEKKEALVRNERATFPSEYPEG